MPYKDLKLQGFRSYDTYNMALSPGVNIVVGPNGSGKTNLLEALYVISTGSSFRAADRDLVRNTAPWFRIEATYDDSQRVLTYSLEDTQNPKHFTLDGTKRVRLGYQQKIPVVLFEPDHLRLLSGPPSTRRDYLDSVLARLQPDFARAKSQFERALLQRNNILKHAERRSRALDDQLFVWNIKLAELAENIAERRLGLIAYMNEHIDQLYSHIADAPSKVHLEYESDLGVTHYKQAMLLQLDAQLDRDILRGFTGVGPHRDDFVLHLNGARSSITASRGEIRSLLLTLKMIELDLLREQHIHPPLLLLDDVFSELDSVRRRTLAALAQPYQTIITTTDADVVKNYFEGDYKIIETVSI
jgi:DNA replication and repair protein RecF